MPGSIVRRLRILILCSSVRPITPTPTLPRRGGGVTHCGQIEVSPPPPERSSKGRGRVRVGGMIGLGSSDPFHGSEGLEACLGPTRPLPRRGRIVSFRPYDGRKRRLAPHPCPHPGHHRRRRED